MVDAEAIEAGLSSLAQARVATLTATQTVLQDVLGVVGVSAPEQM